MILNLLYISKAFGIYKIAVNDVPPFALCTTVFSGFEVDIVRSALSLKGWRYQEQYTFVCASNTTEYDAVLGRVVQSAYKYSINYTYSYPTHNGQLGILVHSTRTPSIALYLKVFSVYLWLIIPAMTVFVMISLVFLEQLPTKSIAKWVKFIKSISWISISGVFLSEQNYTYRLPSKILMVGYLAFMTGMFGLYLAGCVFQTIQSVKLVDFAEKLEDIRYTTYKPYLDYTAIYGGVFIDTGITSDNINEYLGMLSSGYVDAIVLEYEVVMNSARENCDLAVVSKPFQSYFYAVEMKPHVNPELKITLDSGLSELMKTYNIENLKAGYFYSSNSCSSNVNTVDPASLYNVLEIFIAYIIGAVSVFVIRSFCTKRELLKERKRHIDEIHQLTSKPETKIVKITQNQIRYIDTQLHSIMQTLEQTSKKSSGLQEKLMNSIRSKEVRLFNLIN